MKPRPTLFFLIFLWGLMFLSIVAMGTVMPDILGIDDELPLYALFGVMGVWGIFSGLVFKDNKSAFRKYVSIRSPIATLLMTIVLASILGAFYFMRIDPIDSVGYAEGLLRTAAYLFIVVGAVLDGTFLIGFIPAVIVRLFRLAYARMVKNIT